MSLPARRNLLGRRHDDASCDGAQRLVTLVRSLASTAGSAGQLTIGTHKDTRSFVNSLKFMGEEKSVSNVLLNHVSAGRKLIRLASCSPHCRWVLCPNPAERDFDVRNRRQCSTSEADVSA